jgi:hypothetical protein
MIAMADATAEVIRERDAALDQYPPVQHGATSIVTWEHPG